MTPDLRLQIARCDGGTCGDVEDSDAKGSVTDCAAAYRDDGAVLAVAARDDVAAAFHKEGAAAETRKLEGRVTAVAAGFHEGERVSAAATRGKLYVNDFWEFATNLATAAGGAVEAPANGLSFSNGGLWIAHGFGLQRYDVSTGVVAAAPAPPIANATAVAASDESVWVAGASGAARFRDGAWRVFAGRRWLAPGPATAVAAVGSRGALVATAGGLAVFRSENWTLAQKADYFEAVAATTFDRHGLGGDVDLASVGDVSTSTGRPGDNDGLWTSLLTTSYAYAVADAARAEERKTFEALLKKRAEGMEGLFATAAPNHSYPARTVATVDECAAVGCDPPDWHASTTRDGWKYDGRADLSVEPGRGDAGENSVEDTRVARRYKGDTSSDELSGHYLAYGAILALAPSHPSAGFAAAAIRNVAKAVVRANLTLLEPSTGIPTTWGRWDPAQLDERDWSDERGLNALEILAWLRQAEAAGWKEAGAAAAALKEDHGYGRQAVNARITAPDDENFSDDELLVFPLFGHLVYARGADRDPELLCAFSRAWAAGLGRQRGALWGAMHYAVLQDVVTRDEAARRVYETCAAAASPFVAPASVEDRLAAAAADVAWGLENWPLDPVKWGVDQTARGDVELDRVAGRFGEAQLMSVLPPNERSALRWNANPFAAAEGPSSNGDGSAAEDPGAFLLAYRLGKHYGLV